MTSFRPAVADMHAAKTHCPRGHEYTEANIYRRRLIRADGTVGVNRQCIACRNERQRIWRATHPGYNAQIVWESRQRRIARAEGGSE